MLTLYNKDNIATTEKAPAATNEVGDGFVPKFRSVAAIVPM
jgi:hypothetical protein